MNPLRRRILIVDDDPSMCRLLAKILQEAGYDVAQAADGREGWDMVRIQCPHFVITDWDMPGVNGPELCQQIRQTTLPNYVYVVMLTGSYRDLLVEGLCFGADDFITKPVNPRELLARLQAGGRIVDLESKLRMQALRDPLTQLLNRRTFFEFFDTEWSRCGRSGEPLSCMIMDVDHFKLVNDTYGHQAGDEVLQVVSKVLESHSRGPDSVCRYGGEEFCMLLPEADEYGAFQCAERCREAISALTFSPPLQRLRTTASFGVARRSPFSATPAQLVNLADQGLLAAKRAGRNRTVAYSSLLPSESSVWTG